MLADDEKRQIYNHGGMEDLFGMFAGIGHPAAKRKSRVKPVARRIECTLADVYTGNVFDLEVDR